ncbi:hypothetical protein HG530_007864 [Fusarium avenaceum]|nr:hypothetical protein HG530_007864 [Fusarium avenaceum]
MAEELASISSTDQPLVTLRSTTTNEVNDKDGKDEHRDKLQNGVASGGQEASLCTFNAEISKDSRAVLGNSIGSRPLTKHVAGKHQSKSSTIADVRECLLDEIPSIGTGNDLNLVVKLRLDALELRLDIGVVLGKSSESRQHSEGLGLFVLTEKESWSLRGKEGTNAPYQSRDELEGCGKLPLENSCCTNADTRDYTSGIQRSKVTVAKGLAKDTDHVNNSEELECSCSAKSLREPNTAQTAKDCTSCSDSNDPSLGVGVFVVGLIVNSEAFLEYIHDNKGRDIAWKWDG